MTFNITDATIVFEDNSCLVLNKPAGLLTHPTSPRKLAGLHGTSPRALTDWLLENYPDVANVGDQPTLRPGIVHRLDKDTSGLIVVARTQEAFNYLKEQFKSRAIQKTYTAVVYGELKRKSGIIDIPLGKIGTKQSIRIHGKKELDEKTALTQYSLVRTFTVGDTKYSVLEVSPKTGRTHQIRIHLKSIGHPIVGDPIYGGKVGKSDYARLGRFLLHAQKLSFTSLSGQALQFEVDPPEDFMLALSGDGRLT